MLGRRLVYVLMGDGSKSPRRGGLYRQLVRTSNSKGGCCKSLNRPHREGKGRGKRLGSAREGKGQENRPVNFIKGNGGNKRWASRRKKNKTC